MPSDDGIVYPTAYFEADDLTEAQLPYMSVLDAALGQLPGRAAWTRRSFRSAASEARRLTAGTVALQPVS